MWSCTAVGYCSEVCPKGVDPANAVNQNKVNSAKDYFLRFVRAEGSRQVSAQRARRRLCPADGRLVAPGPVLRALHDRAKPPRWSWRRTRIVLLVGVVRLAQGEAAWNGWLAALRSPWSIAAAPGAAGRDVYHT